MNRKGQALVEFILVIPIILFIVIGTIEIGSIIFQKLELENDLDTIVTFYQAGDFDKIDTYSRKQKIAVQYQTSDSYVTIMVSKLLVIQAPILQNILENPYPIKTEKVLWNETE